MCWFAGAPHLVSSWDDTVWRVGPGGTLTDLLSFANRGGESVAVDGRGRVYVANGQVFVYASDGSPVGRIELP